MHQVHTNGLPRLLLHARQGLPPPRRNHRAPDREGERGNYEVCGVLWTTDGESRGADRIDSSKRMHHGDAGVFSRKRSGLVEISVLRSGHTGESGVFPPSVACRVKTRRKDGGVFSEVWRWVLRAGIEKGGRTSHRDRGRRSGVGGRGAWVERAADGASRGAGLSGNSD